MGSVHSSENLAMQPDVVITASVSSPTGGGARDPRVLLNETAHRLDDRPLEEFDQIRTFDTYDGQNAASGPDWYALAFAKPVTANCIEMTMGLPYRDGGWWRSLAVEIQGPGTNGWLRVTNLTVSPPYNLTDSRQGRRPFETYALTFNATAATAVRVIGCPGGLAHFTSLARLALYDRDLSRWNPTALPPAPLPRVYRLIPPRTIWELSRHLAKLTGLTVSLPLMEYYLDETHRQELWRWLSHNYQGAPELWFLIGESLGWDAWRRLLETGADQLHGGATEPHVEMLFHGTMARAVAPVVLDGQILGKLSTHPAILASGFDRSWHRRFARERSIAWAEYQAAIDRSPRLTAEQFEGVAGLMAMSANTIAHLVHRLERASRVVNPRLQQRREIVRQAIDFMEENLEDPVGVAEVARAVNLNPPYFCRLFSEQTGHTPSDYLISLRIERAKEYLAHSPMSVARVCETLGYDASYFSRLFKQRTGYAPGQYARLARGR